MIFLSGSPELERIGGIPTGRLSGIVNHHIPGYLRANQLPSFETNCIEDWETKLDKIVEETVGQNMTLISGISVLGAIGFGDDAITILPFEQPAVSFTDDGMIVDEQDFEFAQGLRS